MIRIALIGIGAALAPVSCAPPRAPEYDLNAVQGIDKAVLSEKARELLATNGFVVCGPGDGDITRAYRQRDLPKFYTVDVMTEVFLAALERAFGELEHRQAERFKSLNASLWEACTTRRVPDELATAMRRLTAIVAVAHALGDPAWRIPDDAKADFDAALAGSGIGPSQLWRRTVDWSVFAPAAAYTATEEMKRHYRVLRWWGHMGFHANDAEERQCAGLLAWLIRSTSVAADILRQIEAPYELFLGPPDDTPISTLLDAPNSAPTFDKPGDRTQGTTARLLPSRRTLDVAILAHARSMPHGIDLLAALGDARARRHATARFDRVVIPRDSSPFQAALQKLWLAQACVTQDPRLPRFMRTDAYRDRGLASALATWTAAREIMTPLATDICQKGLVNLPPPLIEPNLEAWRRLIDLCRVVEDTFKKCGVDFYDWTRKLIEPLLDMAERQLRGEPLTTEDEWHLLDLDTRVFEGLGKPAIDRRVCVSFARQRDRTRWAGKACAAIYVIANHHLYVGGAFDYVEFDRPAGVALTRDDFRALMDSPDAPRPPAWTRSYRVQ